MSDVASLPSYTPPDAPLSPGLTPSYHAEPRDEEIRLSRALFYGQHRRACDFVKQNKAGTICLRLSNQVEGVVMPTYGLRGPIEGIVELAKTDSLSYVVVKVEGVMKLQEIAEGGTTSIVLCNQSITLWSKGTSGHSPCPHRLGFSVPLPTHYTDEKDNYPLPPTYEAHLSGLPGFSADVAYRITAIASKAKLPSIGSLTGIGQTSVATPFRYHPRTRPSSLLPLPMAETTSIPGLVESAEWRLYEATVAARDFNTRGIVCRLYLPRSHVFCLSEPIPFHISFVSSAVTLATLLPFLPAVGQASGKSSTRVQLLRQTCVNVKDEYLPTGTNTELWRVTNIGEGTMRRSADGPRWLSFSGEININSTTKVGGFKASGLWVKDCVVFTITPPDVLKGPIGDVRINVPVRLVTDPYSQDIYIPNASPTSSLELPNDGNHFHAEAYAT